VTIVEGLENMEKSRRDFLKLTGSSALALGMSPVLKACSGKRPPGRKPATDQGQNSAGLEAGMEEILYYASLAPSGHNMQPWRVRRINFYEYAIGIDEARLLPAVDPENREAMLSIGAFVENFCCAASSLGFEPRVEVTGTGAPGEPDLVKVSLLKARASNFPLGRITSRRTVKKGYLPESLAADHVKRLSKVWPGHVFYFDRTTKHAGCLADWTAESFRHQTFRDDAQKELADCIRFGRAEEQKHMYGLTTGSMEITGLAGWYVRNFMNKEDVMGKTFRNRGIDLYAANAREGAGWMIIMSDGNSVADLIETGRRFERMALMVREMGIAIHPMTQILEEPKWREQYAAVHRSAMTPQFILRLGYLRSYPDPVSIRRPVRWFVRT
jgi:nitroreductase